MGLIFMRFLKAGRIQVNQQWGGGVKTTDHSPLGKFQISKATVHISPLSALLKVAEKETGWTHLTAPPGCWAGSEGA